MRPLVLLGDSHVRYFQRAAKAGFLGARPVVVSEVVGATAVGMRNPKSKTDALGRFREALARTTGPQTVVLHLGEVDCGFVIWYRAAKYGEDVHDQARASIASYFAFVDELLAEGRFHVVVTGATLPTLRDGDGGGEGGGEVANLRKEVTATLAERTALTLWYNMLLRTNAAQRALPFVDMASQAIDPATGVVKDWFRHPNPRDHHMHTLRAARLWGRLLRPVLARLDQAADAPARPMVA
ncbi:hypothetical protein ACM64Y_06205 [Novispirillum sp. DQ9]|uniref:hypothetical protein n=1 Tax=Novispirillum sp. DQ9 TaxID=3398612 RepID=UPI003C7A7532